MAFPELNTRPQFGKVSEHTVENGVLTAVSPSQLHTFDPEQGGCPRKWYYDKVLHYPRKRTASQDVGVAVHAQIEHYLLTGENVLGPIALVGKDALPAPKSNIRIEWPIHYIPADPAKPDPEMAAQPKLTVAGLPMVGFIDLLDLNLLEQFIVRVNDHKTTSSIERYAKIPSDLLKDPQSIGYSEWAFRAYPAARTVEFRLLYYQTRGARRFEAVPMLFTRDECARRFRTVEAVVERMKGIAALKNVSDVPANEDACSSYGGCHLASVCSASPNRRLVMSMMDKLNALKATGASPAGNSATTPAPAAGGSTTARSGVPGKSYRLADGRVIKFVAWMGACAFVVYPDNATGKLDGDTVLVDADAAPAPVAAPVTPAATTPPPAATTPPPTPPVMVAGIPVAQCQPGMVYVFSDGKEATFQVLAGNQGVFVDAAQNPLMRPVAELVTQKVVVVASQPTAAGNRVVLTDQVGVVPPDAATAPPVAPATPEAPAAEEKPKRTRKAKAEQVPAPAATTPAPAPAPAATTPAPAPAPEGAPIPVTAPPAPGKGFQLFYNCVPNIPYTDLTEYVAMIAKQVASSAGVEDVRIVDSGPLAFGKWTGYLAETARQNPPKGACVIWKSDLADPIANALMPLAELSVRGR